MTRLWNVRTCAPTAVAARAAAVTTWDRALIIGGLALILWAAAQPSSARSHGGAGTLDPSFGSGGLVVADTIATVSAVAVQRDGKIVVGEVPATDFRLTRYHADGSLDASFGVGGRATTDFGGGDTLTDVVIQGDGRIVAGGYTSDFDDGPADFALARYDRDGSLDPTFGVGGKVVTDLGGGADVVKALALQSDGHLVVAGATLAVPRPETGATFALARYTPAGHLDTTFGDRGTVITAVAHGAGATALVVQPDGRLVAAGEAYSPDTESTDFALVRYTRTGRLDRSFGIAGMVTTDFAGQGDFAAALVIHRGRLVAAGSAVVDGARHFALAAYDAHGRPDPGFGVQGQVTSSFDQEEFSNSGISALVVQGEKLVAAGGASSGLPGNSDFALARYHHNGSLDRRFGVGGRVRTDISGTNDHAQALAIQPNGRLVAAGYTLDVEGSANPALARYRSR